MSDGFAIGLGVVLLGLNAFFVGAEFALISARRAAIEPRAEEGSRAARVALRAMENVSLMMAGAQLGITICTLLLGSLAKPAVSHVLEPLFEALSVPDGAVYPISFAIALLIVSGLHVVIGEMVPKNIALATPERAVLVLAPPMVVSVRILKPFIVAMNWSANHILRLVGVQPQDEVTSAFTRDEVAGFVGESHREGLLDQTESRLLEGALEFSERDASSVLLPLASLYTVAPDVTPEEVERLSGETGFSRFPVEMPGGELTGYLHLKDALEIEERHRTRPIAPSWVRPLPDVGVATPLRAVLQLLQREKAHLGRVRDGDGTVLGVVSLEDVLEELVGEIRDDTQASVS